MVLTEETIYKRLKQESVGTLTTWIFHYQEKLDMIVECWLNSFRTANEELRISLFYLMNDVVQKSFLKGQSRFAQTFQPAIMSAIKLGRANHKVFGAIEKVINIFESRKMYPADVMANMKSTLTNDDDEVIDIDVLDVKAKIEAFDRAHQCFEKGCALIKKAKFKYDELIPIMMRTRAEGQILLDQCTDVGTEIDSFIESAQIRHQRSIELVELLELSIRYFGSELRDANTAEDAYQQFHKGMVEVKCELERMIASGTFPGATPPKDAPSPTPQDDIYAHGVEEVLNSMRAMQRDNNEVADTEIGDDDSAPMPLGPAMPISMHSRMYDHRQLAGSSKTASTSIISGTDPRKFGQMPLLPPGIPMMVPNRPPPLIAKRKEELIEEKSEPQPLSLRNQPLTFENIRGLLEKVKATNPGSPPPSTAESQEKEKPKTLPLSVKAQELPPGVSPSMISPTLPPSFSSDSRMNVPVSSSWLPNRDFSVPPPPMPFQNGSLTQPPQQFYTQPPPPIPPMPNQITFTAQGDQDLRASTMDPATSFDKINDKRVHLTSHGFTGGHPAVQHFPRGGSSVDEQHQNSQTFLQSATPHNPQQERFLRDSAATNYQHQQRYGENHNRGGFRNDGYRGKQQQNYGHRGGNRSDYPRGGGYRRDQGDHQGELHRDRQNTYKEHRDDGDEGAYKRRRDGDGYNRNNYNSYETRGNRGFRGDRGNFKDRRNYDSSSQSRDHHEGLEKD